MRVVRFATLEELAPLAEDWDRLAQSVPFRSWAWLSTWWRHYGPQPGGPARELFVLGVFDHLLRLVAVAPWYRTATAASGNVVRFLGSGEVCSDYLSVLCEPGRAESATEALAEWLSQTNACEDDRWDLLHATGVMEQDPVMELLLQRLAERGHTIHRRPGLNCWRVPLPTSWDEYLGLLSKQHRNHLRRTERTQLDSGRAIFHTVEQRGDLPEAQAILIDLHQRRHRQLGQPGCFSSPAFTAFHGEVMEQLLCAGQLRLQWVELDGQPAAVEYQISGGGVLYAYQSGIDPQILHESPGRLIHLLTVRGAIESGYRALDFLRGDEPYKAHWRAKPHGTLDLRIVPSRTAAQLRHNLWLAGWNVKQWLKGGLRLVTQGPGAST